MARYDYRCTSCGKVFEVSHGMREHPEVVCPDCGAAASREFSASGIVLKGSGFYNTDQRGKSGGTPATGTGKDSGEAPKASGEGKTESKPAEKPAAASSTSTGAAKSDSHKARRP